jgi:enoyl-CoA hydratase/carnithine racemase
MTDQLLVERRDGGIVLLTLNDPSRRNAMSDAMTNAWRDAIADLRRDPELRCVVVTGAGPAFSSGGDLSWIAERGKVEVPALRDHMLDFYRSWLSIRTLEVPTIAAINGAAVGAGLCLALACDLRYVAADSRLIAPFTQLGIHPGMAATHLLPEVVGLPLAREMLFTGRAVMGGQAEAYGLVNRSVPREEVLEVALAVAADIASKGPVATRLTKVALADGGHGSVEDALRWEALAQPVTMVGEDLLEGIAAHREKRAPKFTGH